MESTKPDWHSMSRDQFMQYLHTSIEGLTGGKLTRDLHYMDLMKSEQKEGSPEQPYSLNSSRILL